MFVLATMLLLLSLGVGVLTAAGNSFRTAHHQHLRNQEAFFNEVVLHAVHEAMVTEYSFARTLANRIYDLFYAQTHAPPGPPGDIEFNFAININDFPHGMLGVPNYPAVSDITLRINVPASSIDGIINAPTIVTIYATIEATLEIDRMGNITRTRTTYLFEQQLSFPLPDPEVDPLDIPLPPFTPGTVLLTNPIWEIINHALTH